MTFILEQTRECDGVCCRSAPRFPDRDSSDCIYHDNGCTLMTGDWMPSGKCPALPHLTVWEAFRQTCLDWPQNTKPGTNLGDCCWKWTD